MSSDSCYKKMLLESPNIPLKYNKEYCKAKNFCVCVGLKFGWKHHLMKYQKYNHTLWKQVSGTGRKVIRLFSESHHKSCWRHYSPTRLIWYWPYNFHLGQHISLACSLQRAYVFQGTLPHPHGILTKLAKNKMINGLQILLLNRYILIFHFIPTHSSKRFQMYK